MKRRALLAGLLLLPRFAWSTTPLRRIYGTIVSMEGRTVMMSGRDGETVRVTLLPDARIVAVHRATTAMPDIDVGRLVSVEGRQRPGDPLTAMLIQIFETDTVGSGHAEQGLVVGRMRAAVAPDVIELQVEDTIQRVNVPPTVVVWRYDLADAGILALGKYVWFTAVEQQDGPTAWRVGRLFVEMGATAP